MKVAVEDKFGNVVTGNSSTVSLAVASGPAGFATGSTTSVVAVNGVATFSKLIFNKSGTYTLRAGDGLLTGAVSGTITINAAAASKLVFQRMTGPKSTRSSGKTGDLEASSSSSER